MASTNENKRFTESVFGEFPLDNAIEWIADNLSPEEVFGVDKMIEYVSKNISPEDVYDSKKLEEWALDNGFTKE